MQRVSRRRHADDFKAQAVTLAESIGPAKAARQLDMSAKTLTIEKQARKFYLSNVCIKGKLTT